jgi:diguanylate cyclase (GGDEF)-like protein
MDEGSTIIRRQAAELEALKLRCERAEGELKAIQQRNYVLGVSAPFGILTMDPDGRVTGMNLKMREMLPWPPHNHSEELNIYEFDPLVGAGVSDEFRRCWRSRQTIIRDYSCIQDGKGCAQLRFHLSPIADNTGTLAGVMAFVENHTNLRQAQDAARQSEERYRVLFQAAPVPMIERDVSDMRAHLAALRQSGVSDLRAYFRDHSGEIQRCLEMVKTVDCNDAFLRLLETRDKHGVLSKMPRLVSGEEFFKIAEEGILMVDEGISLPEREMTLETLQGKRKRVICRFMSLFDHEFSRVVIALVDISKRVEAEEALRASERHFREQSLRDNLTGLYNRRFLYQSLPRLIQSARSTQTSLSLLFMDMDDFKSVVDAHGHLNGSRAIHEVAKTILEVIEPPSYAVAYAGDEFVVVLPDHSAQEAHRKAMQVLSRIKATAYLSGQGKAVSLQASCGIASFPNDAEDPEGLLAAADAALFEAKGNRKGTFRHYWTA